MNEVELDRTIDAVCHAATRRRGDVAAVVA